MGYYHYKAIDADGILKIGTVETETIETARNDLSAQGLSILSLSLTMRPAKSLLKGFSRTKVKRIEIIEFATNLSAFLRAGVNLLDALEDIGQSLENRYLRHAVEDIRDRIGKGIGLSEAIGFHKDIFPDLMIRLVAIGEETGRLERSLAEMVTHLQRTENLAQITKRAMIYPVIVLIVTVGMLAFWLFYVLPKVVPILKDLNVALPPLTRGLLAANDFAKQYWFAVVIVAVAAFIVFRVVTRRESMRYYVDLFKISAPLIKAFVLNRLLTTLSEQLRMLVVAGITIDRAMVIVANAIGSEVFKVVLLKVKDDVTTGSRISDAMRQHELLPRIMVRMVGIGESSGNLDNQLEFLGDYYYKKLEDVTVRFEKVLEPFLIVIVGVIYVLILLAIFLPVYDFVSKAGVY